MTLQPTAEMVIPGRAAARGQALAVDVRELGPGWDSLLSQFPEATPFHTAAWAATLQQCYGYRPLGLRIGGMQLPIVEISRVMGSRRGISLPFSDFCAPLGIQHTDCPAARADLLDFGRQRGWRSLEVRGGECLFEGAPKADEFLTHSVDLSVDRAERWNRCSDAAQRAVRKARSADVSVRQDGSESAMRQFYALQCSTRRKHGLPPQPWRFFAAVREQMLEHGLGRLYLAERGGEVIAGAVFLHFGRFALFKYGASNEKHLAARPNNLILWQAIEDYAAAGFAELSLGRTDIANTGLSRYKRGFGATPRMVGYYEYDFRRNGFLEKKPDRLLRLARPILRRLPLPVLQAVGRLAYGYAA